ncbi:hypothetical protein PROFUN_09931 [Planoprotostelium fungivorum]|uniref:Uncharacterized protein n=1 Tax=Planoprotostelium fungivorum TaxID=1890364 RepID=A0A2P6NGA6_9EUKA|nr:hypothetical protein PROFUN_09931 [Planoprotostelium fungivorum]
MTCQRSSLYRTPRVSAMSPSNMPSRPTSYDLSEDGASRTNYHIDKRRIFFYTVDANGCITVDNSRTYTISSNRYAEDVSNRRSTLSIDLIMVVDDVIGFPVFLIVPVFSVTASWLTTSPGLGILFLLIRFRVRDLTIQFLLSRALGRNFLLYLKYTEIHKQSTASGHLIGINEYTIRFNDRNVAVKVKSRCKENFKVLRSPSSNETAAANHSEMEYPSCVYTQKPNNFYADEVLFSVLSLIMFLPQIFLVLKRKSSEGLSFLSIILSAITTVCWTLAVTIEIWPSLQCCSSLSKSHCLSELLPFLPLVFSTAGLWTFYIVSVIYVKPDLISIDGELVKEPLSGGEGLLWTLPSPSGMSSVCHCPLVTTHSRKCASNTKQLALMSVSFLAIASACDAFSAIPQMFKTCSVKRTLSLSIPSLLLRSTFAFWLGSNLIFSRDYLNYTFIPLFLQGAELVVLLILSIYYYWTK